MWRLPGSGCGPRGSGPRGSVPPAPPGRGRAAPGRPRPARLWAVRAAGAVLTLCFDLPAAASSRCRALPPRLPGETHRETSRLGPPIPVFFKAAQTALYFHVAIFFLVVSQVLLDEMPNYFVNSVLYKLSVDPALLPLLSGTTHYF